MKMNWFFETNTDGTTILKQNTFPDLSCFETDILYTIMTPRDIIHFCAQMTYIPQHIAIRITGADMSDAGALRMSQMPQQSLLATYPILPQITQAPSVLDAGVVCSSSNDPLFAGPSFGALPVSSSTSDGNYQWTGSMCDLYNPAGDSIDLESMIRNQEASLWGVGSICSSQTFESLSENSDICDGHIYPS
jgi:hypothetical protein